jgi:tetratricopeptide (TPR) repeat protein
MGRHDWYRRSTWTADDQREFRERLVRSRSNFHKSQYLRIQALSLARAAPPWLTAALELLEEFLRDYPEQTTQLAEVHAQRGACYVELGLHGEAITAFRESLAVERQFPNVKSDAYLEYAELVLALERRDLYEDALTELLERTSGEPFPVQRYRSGAATAFLCDALGRHGDAKAAATRAIAAAGETESPFPYHRQLGVVKDTNGDVQARLWRLAGTAGRSTNGSTAR